ncbi:VOC family protein [Puniceicoccales bacterium CK1056]|uniref:VOC family protein n=1 Tax=Oceanipulchritudo coccoides TaxID=2706888 RepID=A0A6B2M1E1_9BACT|nr:VOC family protein [Oceanipulchritudo coccoides]NDV62162.1 VOC family protein [Oceanipulchritudo coccoides]
MIKRVAHICIHSEDLGKTEAFYCKGLGMKRYFDFQREAELFGFYLKAGNDSFIEVFKGKPDAAEGAIRHVALEVDDIESVLEDVAKAGFPVGEKKMGADLSWQAWLEDPNGVKIELHEYTSESSQLTGRDCVVDW